MDPPAHEASRRRPLLAIGEILLCSSLPTQLGLTVMLQLAGWSLMAPSGGLSLPFVVMLSLGDTALLIALMVWITDAHGERVRSLWVGTRSVAREALVGLLLVPVVLLLVLVLMTLLRTYAPWTHTVPENPLEQLATGGVFNAVVFGLVAILAGGVREELQRAFLLQRFERHLGGETIGVLVLSTAFGLGHWMQGLDAVIATGVLGAFWAVLYLRRGSSVAPLVSHAGFNALEVLRVAIMGA